MKRIVRAGDSVKCVGNVCWGLVVAATEQWVILVNEDKQYLVDHPEDKGVEYAVQMRDIADHRPNKKSAA